MSLVSYDTSDDEESDAEAAEVVASVAAAISVSGAGKSSSPDRLTADIRLPVPDKKPTVTEIASVSYNEADSESTVNSKLKLPAPRSGHVSEQTVTNSSETLAHDLFSGLPTASKASTAKEEELEELVKPSVAELALRQKVLAQNRKRERVKITIPSLDSIGSDSDDESSTSHVPVKKSASGKVGLFQVLPPPKYAGTTTSLVPHSVSRPKPKTDKPSAATTNLVPLSVSRQKPQPPNRASPMVKTEAAKSGQSKTITNSVGLTPYIEDSDDDDEDDDNEAVSSEGLTKFFSTGDTSKVVSAAEFELPLDNSRTLAQRSGTSRTCVSIDIDATVVPNTDSLPTNDAPLQFAQASVSSVGASYQPTLAEAVIGMNDTASSVTGDYYGSSSYQPESDEYDNSAYVDEEQQAFGIHDDDDDNDERVNLLDDEQFVRMCGGRKQRPKEAVTFVDVRADDQLKDVDLLKSLTQESEVVVSHSKKHNKDLPTSQQKRKHQITFLAHKAKERELELKNQWAENRFTRKQTQSKYGF